MPLIEDEKPLAPVLRLVPPPTPTWRWWPFGNTIGFFVVFDKPISRWRRFVTRQLLGSTWERL